MGMFSDFVPKSFRIWRQGYSYSTFRKDLLSGVTVGIIALPLAMAFGIASGVSPQQGLLTAIIGGFLISLFGGSRVQIGGPAGAFVILVYDIIQRRGYEGLAVSTFLAGIFLLVFALCRMGSWIKYIPHPLVTGFTTGLAVIVFSGQIKAFFGLPLDHVPPQFLDKWELYGKTALSFDPATTILGVVTLALALFLRWYRPKLPWGFLAIGVATLAHVLFSLPVATIATEFGPLTSSISFLGFPSFSFPLSDLSSVLGDAIAIAVLGGIESLLSCVISDGMTSWRHNPHAELLGQGIANMGVVFFGGIPATGAIARTATNVKTGAQTPMAGIVHAAVLFCLLTFGTSWVSQVPLTALAAVLLVVAWNMSDLPHFARMLRAPAADVAVLVAAFFLTVLVGITFAIGAGMVLASLLFMKKMGDTSRALPAKEKKSPVSLPEGVELFHIQGPFFFGAADVLQDLHVLTPKAFILSLEEVPFLDASGMQALKTFHEGCLQKGIPLFLAHVSPHAEKSLQAFGLTDQIGKERIRASLQEILVEHQGL